MSASLQPRGVPGPVAAVGRLYASMVECVRTHLVAARSAKVPAYVALPESNGVELSVMKREGLVSVSEADVITDHDSDVLVASTGHMPHLTYLKREIGGLKVLGDDLELLLSKANENDDGDAFAVCCGHVINFDELSDQGSQSRVQQIARLCAVRNKRPNSWTLYCWFDESFDIDALSSKALGALNTDDRFAALIDALAPWLVAPKYSLVGAAGEDRVRGLACLAPIRIACAVHEEGWHVRLRRLSFLGHDVGAPIAAIAVELVRVKQRSTIEEALDVLLDSIPSASLLDIDKDGSEASIAIP